MLPASTVRSEGGVRPGSHAGQGHAERQWPGSVSENGSSVNLDPTNVGYRLADDEHADDSHSSRTKAWTLSLPSPFATLTFFRFFQATHGLLCAPRCSQVVPTPLSIVDVIQRGWLSSPSNTRRASSARAGSARARPRSSALCSSRHASGSGRFASLVPDRRSRAAAGGRDVTRRIPVFQPAAPWHMGFIHDRRHSAPYPPVSRCRQSPDHDTRIIIFAE